MTITRRSLFSLLPAAAIAAMLPRGLSRPVADAEAHFPESVALGPVTSNTAQTIEFNAVRNAVFNDAFNRGYASGMAEHGFKDAAELARLGSEYIESMTEAIRHGLPDVRTASEEMSAALKMAQAPSKVAA